MKNPTDMRARAERYRRHAKAITDLSVRDIINSVANNLEQEAEELEKETYRREQPPDDDRLS